MRLVTFTREGSRPQAGVLRDGQVTAFGTPGSEIDMLAVCASSAIPVPAGPSFDLASVKLMAPVPRPNKLICVGLNYRDHAAESRSEIPTVPTIFNKFPNVVIGPGDKIVLPKASRKP